LSTIDTRSNQAAIKKLKALLLSIEWEITEEVMQEFSQELPRLYKQLHGQARLQVGYRTVVPELGSEEEIRMRFKEKIRVYAQRERERGVTLVGPHRDDIDFQVDGHEVRYFCSGGEQRLLAVTLRLIEYQSLARQAGEKPVLLLDDIFSELDKNHQERIMARLNDFGQCLLTTTHTPLAWRDRFQTFNIIAGKATVAGAKE